MAQKTSQTDSPISLSSSSFPAHGVDEGHENLEEVMEKYNSTLELAIETLCPPSSQKFEDAKVATQYFLKRFSHALEMYDQALKMMDSTFCSGGEHRTDDLNQRHAAQRTDTSKQLSPNPDMTKEKQTPAARLSRKYSLLGYSDDRDDVSETFECPSFVNQSRRSTLKIRDLVRSRQSSSLWKAYKCYTTKSSEEDAWLHKAMALYHRTLEILENELGPCHSDLATVSNNMGNFLYAHAQLDEAMKLYIEAKEIYENSVGPEHIDTAAVYANIGNLLQEREEYDEAQQFHQRALEIKESNYGFNHPDVGAAYLNMGKIMELQKNMAGAAAVLDKVLQIWESIYGEHHHDVACVCEKLAKCLQTLGNFRQSLELHKRALSIWDKTVGVNHPNVATTFFNMANILQAEGKIDDALELYRRALVVTEKSLGPNDVLVASICKTISQVHNSIGNIQEALDFYDKALGIREYILAQDLVRSKCNMENSTSEKLGP